MAINAPQAPPQWAYCLAPNAEALKLLKATHVGKKSFYGLQIEIPHIFGARVRREDWPDGRYEVGGVENLHP